MLMARSFAFAASAPKHGLLMSMYPRAAATTVATNASHSILKNSNNTTTNNNNNKTTTRFIHIEQRIQDLGITLPPPSAPKANYDICCHAAGGTKGYNVLYVSGHLPTQPDGSLLTGKIGPAEDGGKSVDHGYAAARLAGLGILSTLKEQLGDLDRVEQVVKVFGIVQSTDSFKEQHLVMNGCSDVLMEVFGKPTGYHARSAIGTNTLPLDVSVEVEAIIHYK